MAPPPAVSAASKPRHKRGHSQLSIERPEKIDSDDSDLPSFTDIIEVVAGPHTRKKGPPEMAGGL
jgi:hypothetical protein